MPGVPADAFLVGVVGRNQLRKRLDLTIEYFAEWVHSWGIEDAYLYLHVAPTGDKGCDIRSLCKWHGLSGRVILAEPHIGQGVPSREMAKVYSALDVYTTTTQGEGWGLPCLEAMACGVPCVVPDWSALGDWTRDAAYKVHCSGTALTAPLNSLAYTVGGIADRALFVQALDEMYRRPELRNFHSRKGLELASELTWDRTAREFREVLEGVVAGRTEAVAGG
jgi:D-inositol-3-phosphate glycosyltransferase